MGKLQVGVNDFATVHPELLCEWDYEKNNKLGIKPNMVSCGSGKKVYWKCLKCGHSWMTTIHHRAVRNQGCPKCKINKIVEKNKIPKNGFSIADKYPLILKYWDYSLNEKSPYSFHPNSRDEINLICPDCHYSWHRKCSSISRSFKNCVEKFCPICNNLGTNLLPGVNDLVSVHPELLEEWDYEENALHDIYPDKIIFTSYKKVYWKCSACGYKWSTRLYNRTRLNSGCPRCMSCFGTSFSEQAVYYFFNLLLSDTVLNRYRIDNGTSNKGKIEVDIYMPNRKIAIEYDGIYWHRNKEYNDKLKEKYLLERNIKLYRIIESDDNKIDGNKIYYNVFKQHYSNLSWAISSLLCLFGVGSLFVDVESYRLEIVKSFHFGELKNNLVNDNPELAKEWHPTKNGNLTPYDFLPHCSDKVWWLCPKCGYEWQATISNRNSRTNKRNCPVCSNNVVWKGHNDLETLFPDIAKQWHPTLNNDKKPSDFKPQSGKKAWWKCDICGHEWQTRIQQRVKYGTGCPECAKLKRRKKKG